MKSLSDSWHLHRDQMRLRGRYPPDACARAEVERAFFAGAESVVDDMQGMNDAGLTLPFQFVRQLTLWSDECARHDRHTRGNDET